MSFFPSAACSHETCDNTTSSKLANTYYFSVVVLVWFNFLIDYSKLEK